MPHDRASAPAPASAKPSRRGRPRSFDREEALRRATWLFWARGYEATSIADLTEAMGIGSPSLYAAFGSKEQLYAEAIAYYGRSYEGLIWGRFDAAPTAREAVRWLLCDSAKALTGGAHGAPHGCMIALSAVGSEGHAALGALVRSLREGAQDRVAARLERAVAEGEIAAGTDIQALARFVQSLSNGMSILARDGASCAQLEAVAEAAMRGWDAQCTASA